MSEVRFDRVTKRFGDVVAVDDLTLEVRDEEFLVLLGPSGCGKTTALRLVAGLDAITSGELRIGERVVNDVEAKDRDISMVFQSYALYPHMTVAKNIESPLIARRFAVGDDAEKRKLTKAERDERVRDAAGILGLSELLGRKPGALSGGQRQRVALARAIVSRPAAFLFDEPLSNLDAKLRAQTRLELVDLHRRLATTFLYVTHDQVEAMTMADRIAIIADGALQQVGAAQDVYDRPANLFVAGFIGSPPMNLLPAIVRIVDGEPWAEVAEAGRVRLGAHAPAGISDGRPVVLGVRPEHLHVGDGQLAATVGAVEWLGHERHIVLEMPGGTMTVREPTEGAAPTAGAAVAITAEPDEVHLFDLASGERIA